MIKKILYVVIFLFIIACSNVLHKKQELCRQFVVDVNRNKYDIALDSVRIKEDLTKKLNLFASRNSMNICNVILNINNYTYNSTDDEYGVTLRHNINLNVDVALNIDSVNVFNDQIRFFYYLNDLKGRYSNYEHSVKHGVRENIISDITTTIIRNINGNR